MSCATKDQLAAGSDFTRRRPPRFSLIVVVAACSLLAITSSSRRPLYTSADHWSTGERVYGRRAFQLPARRSVTLSLPEFTRDSAISADCFRRLLKVQNVFVRSILVHSAR